MIYQEDCKLICEGSETKATKKEKIEFYLNNLYDSLDKLIYLDNRIGGSEDNQGVLRSASGMIKFESLEELLNELPNKLIGVDMIIKNVINKINAKLF